MKATKIAKLEKAIRPFITWVKPKTAVQKYSEGRLKFLEKLKQEIPSKAQTLPDGLSRKLWEITFSSPIMNAAGMFKNGECYEMVAMQGAGGYLGGTGTWKAREGNKKDGIYLPFVPYPKSGAASNWLGLPNDGDLTNSQRASSLRDRIEETPVGWSIMGSPDLEGEQKIKSLVAGMQLYERAGVDFIEINESCPNTAHGKPQDDDLRSRLEYIKENFLDKRQRNFPVIVKFSNDTEVDQLPYLLDTLFDLGYDGVNFGNTSTKYSTVRKHISPKEEKLFDFYTQTFGGGVSGRPLKELSLGLASSAVEYVNRGKPEQEFHVIRTGGIETINDIKESEAAGISLNQWYTGYFENFAKDGHELYQKLFTG